MGDERGDRAGQFPLGASVTLADLESSPHDVLRELRHREPVSWVGELGAWLVTRRATAVAVLRDPETFTVDDPRFSTAQILGPSMLSLDGTEHERHRNSFNEPFRLTTIRHDMSGWLRAEAERRVADLVPAGSAELRSTLAAPFAVSVITRALGLEDTEPGRILSWYSEIVSDVSLITAGAPATGGGAAAFAELRATVESTIESASRSLLASIAANGSLDVSELAANVGVIMFGAIETSEGMIAGTLLDLLSHPDQMEMVSAHRGMIPKAVEESLRMEPAAAMVDRYATRDIELDGADIRAGDPVTVSLTAANRDPATFADPDRYDILRRNARLHLSFVPGPHACLGMHVARLETAAMVEAVLDLLPGIELNEAGSAPAEGLVFRKPASVVARWGQPSTTA